MNTKKIIFSFILSGLFLTDTAYTCSRFTYTVPENTVVTARSMDWLKEPHTELWAIPSGITKSGGKANNSVKWKSKYGSIIASAYNATIDGINSKGLGVNLLYLSTSDMVKRNPRSKIFQYIVGRNMS